MPTSVASTTRVGSAVDAALHAVRRLSFGPTPALLARVRAMGVPAWVEEQLAPAAIDDAACDRLLAVLPTTTMTAQQISAEYSSGSWAVYLDLFAATSLRQCFSQRQLYERVVEMWSDHLNVTCGDDSWDTKPVEDREVIRRHAMGRYADLLWASATSPAMLAYLDNASSTRKAPNENYARELLELHSVGVDGGYTEADVSQAALVLTGITVDHTTRLMRFRSDWHHVGPLRVLGWASPNATAAGGLDVARSYVDYLAHHPATARRVAALVCRRFVSDTPPLGLVESAAKAYLDADTAIVPVLRHVLSSPEFAASQGQKLRRPTQVVAAALRTLGYGFDPARGRAAAASLHWVYAQMGQDPFRWSPPDGYPDIAAAWLTSDSLLHRWDFHQGAAGGWFDDWVVPDLRTALLPAVVPTTTGALLDLLVERVTGQRPTPAVRAALASYVGAAELAPVPTGLLRWQLPQLVALILDSPQMAEC